MIIEKLTSEVTGRQESLFKEDVRHHDREISDAIKGRRIMVVGGAGSIGSSTVKQILNYQPASLHIVDQSENNLAELVRWLRSSPGGVTCDDFRTLPLDFGSSIMRQFIQSQLSYDAVLNFAALKHVRSEKDPYSVLQMLDTNVVKTARLHKWLSLRGGTCSFFSVSTDKAANPVNLMGASKRLMEHIMFSSDFNSHCDFTTSSTRFANVAFSDGSLLHSFLKRYERKQPLALPKDTRRYFISLEEAGHICLIAAFCGYNRLVLVPNLDPEDDMCTMEEVAEKVLANYGLVPKVYVDEVEAKSRVMKDVEGGCYPLLLTELNTSGEKPCEEFVASGENVVDVGCKQLRGVEYAAISDGKVAGVVDRIESSIMSNGEDIEKEDLVKIVSDVLAEFVHIETGLSLDERM